MKTNYFNKNETEIFEDLIDCILNSQKATCICYFDLKMKNSTYCLKMIKDRLLKLKGKKFFKYRNPYSFSTINDVVFCIASSTSIDSCRGRSLDTVILNNFNEWKKENIDYFLKSVYPTIGARKNTSIIINLNQNKPIDSSLYKIFNEVHKK